jgi:hypothetical protein
MHVAIGIWFLQIHVRASVCHAPKNNKNPSIYGCFQKKYGKEDNYLTLLVPKRHLHISFPLPYELIM